MQPMPIKKRRLYFLFFLVVFLLAIPVLMLYTSGYRLGENWSLVKTGGIYVSAPISGAEIYVNNKLEKTTNLLQHDFFEQNLSPGTYFVFVYKDGYWPWSKELRVHEQLVSDARSFLVPREPKLDEITETLKDEATGKTSPNPAHEEVSSLFSTGTTTPGASLSTKSASATSTVSHDKIELIREGNTIYAKWLGEADKAPSYFCDEYKRNCVEKISVFVSSTKINTFDFYPGREDVVILARKNGIYAVEADKRKVQNFNLIYAGGNPDFRVGSDGSLYVKDNSAIYKVTL